MSKDDKGNKWPLRKIGETNSSRKRKSFQVGTGQVRRSEAPWEQELYLPCLPLLPNTQPLSEDQVLGGRGKEGRRKGTNTFSPLEKEFLVKRLRTTIKHLHKHYLIFSSQCPLEASIDHDPHSTGEMGSNWLWLVHSHTAKSSLQVLFSADEHILGS